MENFGPETVEAIGREIRWLVNYFGWPALACLTWILTLRFWPWRARPKRDAASS